MHKCSKLQMSDSTVRRIYILHCALTSCGQDLITFALDHCIYFKDMRGISRVLPRRLRLLRLRYSGSGFPLLGALLLGRVRWRQILSPLHARTSSWHLNFCGVCWTRSSGPRSALPWFPCEPVSGSPTPNHSPSRHHLLLCGKRLSPAAFAVFSLSSVLSSLIMIFAGLDFFGFIFFGAH